MFKATQQQTRAHNRQLVLQTIYDQAQTSRADIARKTGLTRTTVSDLVAELINEKLVEETGQGHSIGGKPPTLLQFADNSRYLIGVDLASHEFQGAVINLRGQIIFHTVLPVQDRDGEVALNLVYELIDRLLSHTKAPIIGIGIGSPGLIDPINGIIRYSVNLDWRDLPLASLVRERYNLPVQIANNSHAAAIAETTFGSNRDASNLIVVKIGRGIAAGIVINGEPYFGEGYGAGEIGHLVIKENGDLCRCGHYGCLETVASSSAIIKQAKKIACQNPNSVLNRLVDVPQQISLEIIMKAYREGDPDVVALINSVSGYLGMAVANLVSALNIKNIVISGILTSLGEPLIESLQKKISSHALASLAEETRVEASALGQNIVILGVAALLMQRELGLY
ncbi:MAG: ROK family transcriptional regulator [Anaerolineae bacterium]|nr:ROK family transcriptional regulator [Anaerolineae bacterium]